MDAINSAKIKELLFISHSAVSFNTTIDRTSCYTPVEHLDLAGLDSVPKLFLRDEAMSLLHFLDNVRPGMKYVINGPPGSGKSTLTWAWACDFALNHGVKILWLHYQFFFKNYLSSVVLLNGNTAVQYEVSNTISELLEVEEPRVFIFDGVTQDLRSNTILNSTLSAAEQKTAIFVSSESVPNHSSMEKKCKYHAMMSWSIDQYEEACSNENFFDSIKDNLKEDDAETVSFSNREYLIDRKFYYAGSCAHWFFSFKLNRFPEVVDEAINRVESYESFYKGDCGPATNATVHHLQSVFSAGKKHGIVSEYAAVTLFFKVQLTQVRQFLSCPDVKKNPAFEGWVRELEFLVHLRTTAGCEGSKKLSVKDKDGVTEEWTVQGYTENFDPDNITQLPTKEWLIPRKWNQGAYDFIQFSDGLLRVVQVTRAKGHELKLQYVVGLMDKIKEFKEVKFLDVVVIVSPDKLYTFNAKVTGDYQLHVATDFKTKKKWKQNCIRILQLTNAYQEF